MSSHWSHSWPSASVLSSFIASNTSIFNGKTILELGSGSTGIAGIAAAKAGAHRVVLSDRNKTALAMLTENITSNGVGEVCEVQAIDWSVVSTLDAFLSTVSSLHLIVCSDVFFDPSVFSPLIFTISTLLTRFPKCQLYLAYQKRDDNWSLEADLEVHSLSSALIRSVEQEEHTIELAVMWKTSNDGKLLFAGVEGGASFSKLVLIDEEGTVHARSEMEGTNYHLKGVQKTADEIASWVRRVKAENGIAGTLRAIGMGLSGAEDVKMNTQLVDYLLSFHGDIAQSATLQSDAVANVAACFERGGVVMIAGTGSSCRMLTPSGEVKGAGGWGHAIGDGGSAYWIANRGIRLLFDVEDGIQSLPAGHSIHILRQLILNHFDIDDKVEILDFLYAKFNKSFIASLTKELAHHEADPVVCQLFYDAGHSLGAQLRAVTQHISPDDKQTRDNLDVLLVGSVFKSWKLLRPGFVDGLAKEGTCVNKFSIYQLHLEAAQGAAVLAARDVGVKLHLHHPDRPIFDTL